MITEFGGAVAVPNAVRSKDSTTTMRVNDVIMIRIEGAIDNIVSSAISWIARSVTPPPPWPPPRLMLMSCANAGPASAPAVAIRTTRRKTLRGNLAGLTKTSSSDGPAGTPSRLRDFQSRSFAEQEPRAGPRCAVDAPRAAVRARPAVRHRRRPGDAMPLPAAAPSRRGFGRRSTAAEEAPAVEAAAVPRRVRAQAHEAAAAPSAARPPAAGAASSARNVAARNAACAAEPAQRAARAAVRDGHPSVPAQNRTTHRCGAPAADRPGGAFLRQRRDVPAAAAARA